MVQGSRFKVQGKKLAVVMAISLIWLILPQTAQAATYYVDANNGNDNGPGTEAQPWKTPTKAGNTAIAGDTVVFMPGTYTNQLAPANSGTSGNMITFKAATRRTAVINTGTTVNATALTGRSYIRIEGFEITGSQNVIVAVFSGYSTHLEIVDNYIHGNSGFGIYMTRWGGLGKDTILVEDNEFYDNGGNGVFIDGDDVIVRNNKIHYNGADGIEGGGDNWLVENNLVYDYKGVTNHQDGINFSSLSNSIIRYNVVRDYTQNIYFPLKDWGGSLTNVKIYGNLCYTTHQYDGGWYGKGIFIDGRNDSSSITNVEIHSNTIGWHPFSNIMIAANEATTCSNIEIYNNLLYGDPLYASITVTASKQSVVTSNYNLFYGCAEPSFEGANSITADPLLVDYIIHDPDHVNFHLKADSPAISAGNPNLASAVTLPSPFLDIDGNTRPQGSGFDMGAYEYQSSTFLYGDVSGDGEVSAYDAALTARIAVGLDPIGNKLQIADVSGDGQVSAYDAALIAQRAVGLISKFPIE